MHLQKEHLEKQTLRRFYQNGQSQDTKQDPYRFGVLRLQYDQAKLQQSVKQVKQKDVQGYEFYMEHLVDEAGEMAVKGNCDSIVTKLMQ